MTTTLAAVTIGIFLLMILLTLGQQQSWINRLVLVGLYAILIIPIYMNLTALLSRPLPWHLVHWVPGIHAVQKDAAVYGYKLDEGKGIYLLVQFKGESEPRYIELPWSTRTAEALEQQIAQSKANPSSDPAAPQFMMNVTGAGGSGRGKSGSNNRLDGSNGPEGANDIQFYPLPQQGAPLKQLPPDPLTDSPGNYTDPFGGPQ